MDKTTTWLVRGAALTVIFVGWVSYLDPYLKKQDEIRFNKNYENQLRQANQRCEKLEKISYYQLLDLVKSGQITRINLSANNGLSEVKTKNNTFAASIAPDKELLALFSANNIDIAMGYCQQMDNERNYDNDGLDPSEEYFRKKEKSNDDDTYFPPEESEPPHY